MSIKSKYQLSTETQVFLLAVLAGFAPPLVALIIMRVMA
jgi:hypothetical protein